MEGPVAACANGLAPTLRASNEETTRGVERENMIVSFEVELYMRSECYELRMARGGQCSLKYDSQAHSRPDLMQPLRPVIHGCPESGNLQKH